MGRETSAETSPKESRRLSDGVVWKAYGFDKQGKPIEKEWDLTEDTGNRFSWYHGELPNRNQKLSSFENIFIEKLCPDQKLSSFEKFFIEKRCPDQKLSSFEKIFIKKLCPPLKEEDITRMVSGGPFCDHVDGALFLRVNSSGPSLSNFELRLAARITHKSVITMSLGPNLFPEKQNLVRNDEMVELDEIVIEKGDGPKNSNLVRNEEKGVAAKNGFEELNMKKKEVDKPLMEIIKSLLIHIVKGHMDHLQYIVTKLEIDLDTIEASMEWMWENIEAIAPGGGTVEREMWDDRRLAKMHLDLPRLLQYSD